MRCASTVVVPSITGSNVVVVNLASSPTVPPCLASHYVLSTQSDRDNDVALWTNHADSITALQNQTATLQTDIANLQNSMTALTAGVSNVVSVQAEPFDLTTASAAFAFFFGSTLLLYSVAKGAGAILSMIRHVR